MAGWLDSKMLTLLEGGLDGLSLRNKVLADNIANVDTPNFKRSDVDFDKVLQAAMGDEDAGTLELKRTSPRHLAGVPLAGDGFVVPDLGTAFRNDGNNVDIDSEMTKLAENTLQYNALARALTSQFALLKQATES
jgi:flagellar basal-body rod protein FlgB